MKAMILAAGLGTRLLPYTIKRPKPLFPILNNTLLQLTVTRIKKSGFTEIIVNCHHLRQQIREALQHEANCILQEEEKILGTGGGLRKALPHFNHEPVLIANGDIYHTINYQEVYNSHCRSKADVTLVLHDYPRFNDVAVDEKLTITGFNSSNEGQENLNRVLAFTGIHVINPDVLRIIPPDAPYCIIECYKQLLKQGGSIRMHLATGHFWTDMGTPEDYLQLHSDLLKQKIPLYEELKEAFTEAPFVGTQNASIAKDVKLLDWACIGKGSTIGAGVTIERSIVWENAAVPAGSVIQDAIVIS